MRIGFHIGEICRAAPTAADDMALGASSLAILQRLISAAVGNSKLEKYILQPNKDFILAVLNQCKRAQETDISITEDGVRMPVVTEAMHMGMLRSADSQESAVNHYIDKARRTTYCLMGASLQGNNGLDPDTSIYMYILHIFFNSWFMD